MATHSSREVPHGTLVKTIVQELGWTADATPVNSDQATAWLSQVTQAIDETKAHIQRTILDQYDDFAAQALTCHRQADQLDSLSVGVASLAERVLDPHKGIQARLTASLEKQKAITHRVEAQRTRVQALQEVQRWRQTLARIDALVKAGGDYELAANAITELTHQVNHAVHAKNTHVAKDLAARLANARLTIAENIGRQFTTANAFTCLGNCITLTVQSPGPDAPPDSLAPSALAVLAQFDLLHEPLTAFGRSLLKHVVAPMCQLPAWALDIAHKDRTHRLTLTTNSDVSTPARGLESLFAELLRVVTFVRDWVLMTKKTAELHERQTYLSVLGTSCADGLVELLYESHLKRSIPTHKSQFPDFNVTAAQVQNFEVELISLGFFTPEQCPLTAFVTRVDEHYVAQKRSLILDNIRRLLREQTYSARASSDIKLNNADLLACLQGEAYPRFKQFLQAHDTPFYPLRFQHEPFAFPSCQITHMAQQFVQLLYQTMDEAVGLDAYCARALHTTVRDACHLLRAHTFGGVASEETASPQNPLVLVPSVAALTHNDCLYIAHHLLTLGFVYWSCEVSDGPESAAVSTNATTFVDLAALLRTQGEQVWVRHLTVQRQTVLETLQACQGLQEAARADRQPLITQALRQAVAEWQRLSDAWRSVLPTHLYLLSSGRSILDALLQTVTEDVLDVVDIGVDDSQCLYDALHQLVDAVAAFRRQALDCLKQSNSSLVAAHTIGSDRGHGDDFTALGQQLGLAYLPSAAKFMQVRDILMLNMSDIMARFDEGVLAAFTANELSNLICALFADSPLRTSNLTKIRQHSR
ncbi:ribosome biogenesis protein ytm1 [Dimargaris verticillata]|uniref:Ribosome biogenesis protein ytm1 n=1 Tax=Dimargaris verticillata TaxID=2761393 RepID=A0A9W8B6L8_9FUNG|nr:ribosome biogenesis protein ytm1 [Dimargaris verticillata]